MEDQMFPKRDSRIVQIKKIDWNVKMSLYAEKLDPKGARDLEAVQVFGVKSVPCRRG